MSCYNQTTFDDHMAHHASAIKRIRQSKKRKAYNKGYKTLIKNAAKAVRSSKDLVSAEANLREAAKVLDRSAAKGIIHKNTAANRKSALARFVNKISRAAAGVAA